MPFLLSSRGYGLHLDTTADAVVELTAPDAVPIRVAAAEVGVHLMTGPHPAAVIRRHHPDRAAPGAAALTLPAPDALGGC